MSKNIAIAPRFRRSVRIDSDFASVTAIDGFYCPASFQVVVKFMAAHVADAEQGAFTWTGPYGGGKSSLALALACLFGAPKPVREQAASLFGKAATTALKTALPHFPARWSVLPLVTERRSISEQLAESLGLPAKTTSSAILGEIERRSKGRGLLLIMDELGRGLEAAADESDGDIHLLQDIAELASRSKGKLVLLGILHQAFEAYAERLSRKARDSWAKIQGRFVDISVSVSLEENIELIGEALGHQRAVRNALPLAEACVEHLRSARKKSDAKRMAGRLGRTAPLHPFTACLLGPLSRRRFSQNQRSVFSFLSSAEPFGLQDALNRGAIDGFYPPYLLWNYLQANFEPAILSSPDGRRWALAHDVIERALARGANDTELKVLKTIAILDLLKDRSGLATRPATIMLSLQDIDRADVDHALARLTRQSEIVFRKYSGLYTLYAGSDFDVEARLRETIAKTKDVDINLVRTLADLQPMLAKRHREETGAMRWFETSIEPISKLETLPTPKHSQDTIGRVIFSLPTQGETPKETASVYEHAIQSEKYPLFIGHHPNADRLLELARELTGLSSLVGRFPELTGDPIARREIDSRITEVRQKLENSLHGLIGECLWYGGAKNPRYLTKRLLNEQLSNLAAAIFSDTPNISNELLNCSEPSSNAVSARTKLMKRMAIRASEINLGFGGKNYPAERGLYISLLQETGLHIGGEYKAPSEGEKLYPLWREADKMLATAEHCVISAHEIIKAWGKAPIGLKAGLGPVFIVAYILSRRTQIAVYGEGVFQSSFNELCVEFLARDAKDIGLRRVEMEGFIGETLEELGSLLKLKGSIEPLLVARTIIGEFDMLVPWTAKTQSLSPQTLRVREILKRANDPNKLLFDDLPQLTKPLPDGRFDPNATALLLRDALAEMRAAYPKVIEKLKGLMLRELDVRGQGENAFGELRDRADNIRQIGGNLRLEAFVGRLTQFHGTREDMEGIASIAANKLPRDWNDGDRERAAVGIVELAASFLRTETMARVKGRKDRRHALAVLVGKDSAPHSLFREFEIADTDRQDVERLASIVDKALNEADQRRRDVILAALIEVTSKYIDSDKQRQVGGRT